jgi:hypothetical protein
MAWLELQRHRPLDPRELEPFGVDEQFAKMLQQTGHLGPLKRKNPLAWWLHQRRDHGLAALGASYLNSRPDDLRYLLELGYDGNVVHGGPGPIRALVDIHVWEQVEAERRRNAWEAGQPERDDAARVRTADLAALAASPAQVVTVAPPISSDVPTATLYRFYDADNNLLYIGQSIRAYERVQRHRRDAPWFPDAANVTFQQVPAAEILRLEAEAIRAERPRYNITHRADQP